MDELEIFSKRIKNYIEKAKNGGVSLLNFLDDAHLGVLKSQIINDNNVYYYGGFKNADTLRAIISPYEVLNEDFKIVVFKIIYNKKYYEIGHRNVLGSLMNLGIKRECIGDIVINDDIFFACTEEISDYIKDNLNYIGNAPVNLEKIDYEVENVIKYESKEYFITSLRIDNIISAAYNLSRKESHDMIINGLVFINHVLCLNPSKDIKLGEEISVRKKGRVKLSQIGGNTKSGRIVATLAKRI